MTGGARDATAPLVVVYADESCLGNGREGANPGGAAGLIEWARPGTGAVVRRDYWVSEPATTNNRMALRSLLEALRILSAKGRRLRVLFVSDSNYIVKGVTEWLPDWIARDWRRKGGVLVNEDLWRQVPALLAPHEYRLQWVQGHNAHVQNEYANYLAVEAARRQTATGGAVPSRFEAWLTAERSRGRMAGEPDPFPDPRRFRPAPALPTGAAGRPR